jgi:hypothetical protein
MHTHSFPTHCKNLARYLGATSDPRQTDNSTCAFFGGMRRRGLPPKLRNPKRGRPLRGPARPHRRGADDYQHS